jgi:conjugal transfer pilus assembly protein TraF
MAQLKPLLLLGVSGAMLCSAYGQAPNSYANSPFGSFRGDGYYWYKVDPEEAPKPKEEPPKRRAPGAPAKAPVKALSTQWLRANMPKLLDAAVDDPTKENVANYMYAQRVLLDKAQSFSQQVKETVSMDPFLDENNRVPIAQFAQASFLRDAKRGQDEVLKEVANKSGIWVFVDTPDKCSACQEYVSNVLVGAGGLEGVATKYKFDFKTIFINSPEGKVAAKKLNLKVTPTTVLVVPPSGYFLVSQGLMSQDRLQERLMIAAKTSGVLPKNLVDKINPYDKGLLSNEQLGNVAQSDNPSDVMKNLRDHIKGD